MSRLRCFRKCLTCGCYGHSETRCALKELNAQQEANAAHRQADIKLGLTPALELEIALIRRKWSTGIHLVTA